MRKTISVTFLLASDDRTSAAKDFFVSEMSRGFDESEKRCVTSIINDTIRVNINSKDETIYLSNHIRKYPHQ